MAEHHDIMQDIMERDISEAELNKKRPSQDTLEYLHYDKGRTLADIGRMYGVAARDVYGWLKYYDLSKNKTGPISDLKPSRDLLKHKYYNKGYMLKELSEYYGISQNTVEGWITSYELSLKKRDAEIKQRKRRKRAEYLPSAEELKEMNRKGEWQMSEQGKRAKAIDAHIRETQTGLYASIPIICQADECPFFDACHLAQMGEAPEGDRCAIEINTIEKLMEKYTEELDVDVDDMVDISIIRDVIDIDVSLMRINKNLAKNPEIVQDVIAGIGEDGTAYEQPEINKAYELQSKLMKQRRKLLRELHATRKEKAKDDQDINLNVSDTIEEFKNRLKNKDDNVIDVEAEGAEGKDRLAEIEEEVNIEQVEVTSEE